MYSKRFERAISALVEGYKEGTLQSGNCHACAVGNIICKATNNGYKKDMHGHFVWKYLHPYWNYLFVTDSFLCQKRYKFMGTAEQFIGMEQIISTGYSVEELMEVERIFETTYQVNTFYEDKDPMYDALMAVVDVLLSFEEDQEPEREKEVKSKFLVEHG